MSLEKKFTARIAHATRTIPAAGSLTLSELAALKKTDSSLFQDYLFQDHPPIDSAYLHRLCPPDNLPRLIDGEVTVKCLEHFGVNAGKIVDRTFKTHAATAAQKFLDAIEYIEADNPEFLQNAILTLSDHNRGVFVLMLHFLKKRPDLIEQAIANRLNEHTFHIAAFNMHEKIGMDNVYDADHALRNLSEHLVSAYVIRKMPKELFPVTVSSFSQTDLMAVAEFVSKYSLTPVALDHFLEKAPIPECVMDIHRKGQRAIENALSHNPDLTELFADYDENFAEFSLADKLIIGQQYLNLLALAYGFAPPPELTVGDVKSLAHHTAWSEDKEECFAHPLGLIKINPDIEWDNFFEFLSTMSHEFTHALESASILSLNPQFQEWQNRFGQEAGVKMGIASQKKNLQATGLIMSFNAAADERALFQHQDEVPHYASGVYHPGHRPEHGDDAEKNATQYIKYRDQIRERHAFKMEDFIANSAYGLICLFQKSRDPIHPLLECKALVSPIEDILKNLLLPLVPPEKADSFRTATQQILSLFKATEEQGRTYSERTVKMKEAMAAFKQIIANADKNEFIPRPSKINAIVNDIYDKIKDALYMLSFSEYHMAKAANEKRAASAITDPTITDPTPT